jgi:hypothetical protein
VEKPSPICACCRKKINTMWVAWSPRGLLTCAGSACIGWAESQRLQEYSRGLVPVRKGPVRPRGKPRCDYCGKERPPLRDCFRQEGLVFCTLTCQERSMRIGHRA